MGEKMMAGSISSSSSSSSSSSGRAGLPYQSINPSIMSLKSCCLHIHLRKQRFCQPPLLLQAQKEEEAAAAEEEEAVIEDNDNRNMVKGHKRKLMLSSSMAHPSKASPSHSWSCFKRLLRKQFLPTSLTDNSDTAPLLPNKLPHKLVQLKEIDANIQEGIHKSAFVGRFKGGATMDAKATSLVQNSDTAPLLLNKLPNKLVQLKEIDANIQEDMHKSAFASRFKEGAKMDAKSKSSNQGCLVKAELFSKKLHKRNKKGAISLSRENKPFNKLFSNSPQEGSELLLASNT